MPSSPSIPSPPGSDAGSSEAPFDLPPNIASTGFFVGDPVFCLNPLPFTAPNPPLFFPIAANPLVAVLLDGLAAASLAPSLVSSFLAAASIASPPLFPCSAATPLAGLLKFKFLKTLDFVAKDVFAEASSSAAGLAGSAAALAPDPKRDLNPGLAGAVAAPVAVAGASPSAAALAVSAAALAPDPNRDFPNLLTAFTAVVSPTAAPSAFFAPNLAPDLDPNPEDLNDPLVAGAFFASSEDGACPGLVSPHAGHSVMPRSTSTAHVGHRQNVGGPDGLLNLLNACAFGVPAAASPVLDAVAGVAVAGSAAAAAAFGDALASNAATPSPTGGPCPLWSPSYSFTKSSKISASGNFSMVENGPVLSASAKSIEDHVSLRASAFDSFTPALMGWLQQIFLVSGHLISRRDVPLRCTFIVPVPRSFHALPALVSPKR
mmetsp:Transcript_29374/g.76997  ORF Transcript_29374/g.76997 Transcript_29374/m.76997 type:complete len:432 (-) Transcript_29374:1337-2632(-)